MTREALRVIVTGGAGFIGSAVCRRLVQRGYHVVNVDALTYSASLESLREIDSESNYHFYREDIRNEPQMEAIMAAEQIDAVMHLAAESHVDRSIDGPAVFIEANVVGTFRLLNAALRYWRGLEGDRRSNFRFHHVSTDEVFGDLPFDGGVFTEKSPYSPSSPYSASKAAADHLVRAWHATYGLPVVVSNCSNNYGPYHFPEKLVPLTIINAIEGKPLPVYGSGENVRDWLHVDDHARALELILMKGRVGESYNVGGRSERTNLSVVKTICEILDRKRPLAGGRSHRGLIAFVEDRPGHDRRYAIDASKIDRELGWRPEETFEQGIDKTIDWYLANDWWWRPLREQRYAGARLGTAR